MREVAPLAAAPATEPPGSRVGEEAEYLRDYIEHLRTMLKVGKLSLR